MQDHLKKFNIVTNPRQILIGIGALFFGSFVYLFDRSSEHTYFILMLGIDTGFLNSLPDLFGQIGNWLPSFIHLFSFILITAGIMFSNKKEYIVICAGWFFINCVFELGQKYNALVIKAIPDWFAGIPFFENTENYFSHGTFDYFDLASILIATVIAYVVLMGTKKAKV